MSDEKIPPSKLIAFLREKRSIWFIAAALILGILLMLCGRSGELPVSGSGVESRLKALCEEVDGVSGVRVMVICDDDGKVTGAAVVCSGGDNDAVKLKLTNMIRALFGIGADSVSILGSDED